MIQHMVLLKFREGVEQSAIAEAFAEVRAMQHQIPGITYLAGGEYTSPEGLNDGFTHGFLVTFASAQARDDYLPHPEHERVKNRLLPLVERVIAFDFVAD